MLVVGLTGGIGSGKSTVAGLLAAHGAEVIDVDALGREVLLQQGGAYDGVVSRFGPAVVRADGEIDRAALARMVFGDQDALDALTAISHPAINGLLRDRVAAGNSRTEVVVLDMAVLVESDLGRGLYGPVVTVEAPWPLRLARLQARGLSATEATARRDAQARDAERRAVATHVVVNDGDRAALARHVEQLWPRLVNPSAGSP